MFEKSARFYDAIYAFKDYQGEAERIHELIQQHKQSDGTALLDVACGTGTHLAFLKTWYSVEGLDINPELLAVARKRTPGVSFHQANMVDFHLDCQFDVITCLFGSIGYVKTTPQLCQTLQNMRRHTLPGGVVILEPWLTPEMYYEGLLAAVFVDDPDLKLARMSISAVEDGVSVLVFHYLVGTPDGVEYFTEQHELGLFTHEDYLEAFGAAGLEVVHDLDGLTGRGLYIGLVPCT